MEMELMDLWIQMGPFVRAIVVVLVAMSVGTLAVAFVKWWKLSRMAAVTRHFAPEFSRALQDQRVSHAMELTALHGDSHVAQVLGRCLRDVAPFLKDDRLPAPAIDSTARAVEREQILLASQLKSGLGFLATIGSTAPFVGLLGTVIGIVNSFRGIAETGGGGLEAVSAGIAEALIATAIGLLAAIPAVWLYNYFNTRLEVLFAEVAYAGRELVDWMTMRAHSGSGAALPSATPGGGGPS